MADEGTATRRREASKDDKKEKAPSAEEQALSQFEGGQLSQRDAVAGLLRVAAGQPFTPEPEGDDGGDSEND